MTSNNPLEVTSEASIDERSEIDRASITMKEYLYTFIVQLVYCPSGKLTHYVRSWLACFLVYGTITVAQMRDL